ncbi:MAG: gamma-glutamyltransferase family protein [Pseudomonadaceae bacterium]|nr:gamma-glutamyltransferase family protein [Pseudomonadaceae bacterium]
MTYDPSQPYSSGRSPIAGDNIVTTSQPLAAQAGLQAIRRGGNAVDAAIATAIALTVVEPNNNGVGSDAFALVWDGSTLHGLNASGRSPAGWTRERFAGRSTMPLFGWDAVTVPGAVSAWAGLSERFGALPFADLFEDAIRYAHDGFHVGAKSAFYWKLAEKTYRRFPDFTKHFLPAPAAGERFVRRELAATLTEIAETGGASFYTGNLAEQIVRAARDADAVFSADDLATHSADWVNPTSQRYRDVSLHEIPPNGQGLAAQIALGILAHVEAGELDSSAWVHTQLEAMKIAVRAAAEHIADIDHMRVGIEALLDPDSLARAADTIGERAAELPPLPLPTSPDTVYLSTADANGMMVSLIQSNYLGFGSGVVIPGTGISMQNRGNGFSLTPGHANEVGPGKRPFHTIIPGFVTGQSGALASFGVMGGHMQHQGHVQMVSRLFDHGQNPQAASDAPRWHVFPGFDVAVEPHFNNRTLAALADRGHRIRVDHREHLFGGAQLIKRTDDGYVAGSDHRKEGQAVTF